MDNRWNWLKNRLNELGSNPSRFAKELDWPASRVYELFSGKTKAIPLDRLAKASAILGVSLDNMINFNSGLSDDICFGTIYSSTTKTDNSGIVPELDLYEMYPPMMNNDWDGETDFLNDISYTYSANYLPTRKIKDNWKIPDEYLEEINIQQKNVYIIEAMGDSMTPTVSAGDKVIIDTSAKGKFPSPDGIFAIWDGLGIAIKRIELIPNSEPPALKIISDNPRHSSYERKVEECRIVGRIVSVIKRL